MKALCFRELSYTFWKLKTVFIIDGNAICLMKRTNECKGRIMAIFLESVYTFIWFSSKWLWNIVNASFADETSFNVALSVFIWKFSDEIMETVKDACWFTWNSLAWTSFVTNSLKIIRQHAMVLLPPMVKLEMISIRIAFKCFPLATLNALLLFVHVILIRTSQLYYVFDINAYAHNIYFNTIRSSFTRAFMRDARVAAINLL